MSDWRHEAHDWASVVGSFRCPGRDKAGKSLGYDISGGEAENAPGLTEFQGRVLGILEQSSDVYRDRSAVYKDNFRSVGRVMVALFPDGRPPLVTAADDDRWHIFELIIVKLTRYANNYDVPHEDSLLDMLPYLGILGGLDQELRERAADGHDDGTALNTERAKNTRKHTAWPRHPAEYGVVPCSMCDRRVSRANTTFEWKHEGDDSEQEQIADIEEDEDF